MSAPPFMARIERLEAKLNIEFKNINLLKEALTHRSYLNEHPDWPLPQNERLEYLGDAVLELVVSEALFDRYPASQEGKLTSLRAALVNYQMLAKVAHTMTLEEYLYLSRGESRDQGKAREVILANAVEAVLGAVYLDQGYSAAKEVVETYVLSRLGEVLEKELYRDPKSVLQEIVQERHKITPTYRLLETDGPDHNKRFLMAAYVGEKQVSVGRGASKQEAEAVAAQAALTEIEKENK